jgi:hypothetical protein
VSKVEDEEGEEMEEPQNNENVDTHTTMRKITYNLITYTDKRNNSLIHQSFNTIEGP